jgi:hypothetical protein
VWHNETVAGKADILPADESRLILPILRGMGTAHFV